MRLKNPKKKGTKVRLQAIKELESQGYQVAVVERTGKFVKIKDMFGLFDLVAISPYQIRFIQVTTNVPHSHKKYEEFSKKYADSCAYTDLEQWVKPNRKAFIKYYYVKGIRKKVGCSI